MKVLIKGNVAVAEGAIAAGCRLFFGYPITPQNEIPEHMSKRMPEVGGVYLQAESEVAAINMVMGAAAAGARVITTSSSPGISLMQEGISYIVTCELPCVIVNVVRGGPGLGNVLAAQSDYFQAVKGGGHGDYHLITLAPWSGQEMYELTYLAFDIADRYRHPVMVLADGILGQMMEPVELGTLPPPNIPPKPWATTGAKGRKKNVINSLEIVGEKMEQIVKRIFAKYEEAKEKETRWQEIQTEDAELILVAYGTSARVCKTVVDLAREEGLKIGLLRPITLFPFPSKRLRELAEKVKAMLVVEMSMGQMVEDVKLSVECKCPVYFYGRTGGVVPKPKEILAEVKKILYNKDNK
jgi:2-oxoglutarate ferredoxin oxidoreductase subunit alpha